MHRLFALVAVAALAAGCLPGAAAAPDVSLGGAVRRVRSASPSQTRPLTSAARCSISRVNPSSQRSV